MNQELKNMLDEFGVKSTNELLLHKQKKEQTKIFSSKKPQIVNLTSDECKKLCDKSGIHYAPGFENRVLQYVVSDERQDRYGDIVRAKGAKFENYLNNPVMFFGHQYERPPIGNALKIWIDRGQKNVQSWGLFVDDSIDKTGFSDLIFRLASSGFMKACSVGFMPLKANVPKNESEAERMGLGRYGVEFTEWDTLEWSPCGVPANPGALQNALKDINLVLRIGDLDVAEKFKLFDNENLLDMFASKTVKATRNFSLPILNALPEFVKAEARDMTEEEKEDCLQVEYEQKKVVPFKSYTLATIDTEWDGDAQVKKADTETLKAISTWYDEENSEKKSAYKLPHHLAENKNTVWRGVAAAMGALLGARGGVDIPEDEKKGVYNHLAKHYKEFDKEVPEFKEYTTDELAELWTNENLEIDFTGCEDKNLGETIETPIEVKYTTITVDEYETLKSNQKQDNVFNLDLSPVVNETLEIKELVGEVKEILDEVRNMKEELKELIKDTASKSVPTYDLYGRERSKKVNFFNKPTL